MPRAFSPTKSRRYAAHSTNPKFQFPSILRRSRWLYLLLAFLAIYLWILPARFSLLSNHGQSTDPLALRFTSINWSRYAYSQYATTSAHLCNSIMLFETLSRLGSKPDRLLFYPSTWDTDITSSRDRDSQLLVMARDKFKVKLIPVDIPSHQSGQNDGTYYASFAKFLAWDETDYDRILQLDSDVTMLRHLDELFLLPKAPVAMPRAYWKLPRTMELTSLLILLQPSATEFERLMDEARGEGDYDGEILNRLYGNSALILPHREYGLISGEFRSEEHKNYLGNVHEVWDAEKVISEASLVHFSDWPLPKPWVMWPHNLIQKIMPKCKRKGKGEEDCRDKHVWLELYNDFRKRRRVGWILCSLCAASADDLG
ncbi:N-acetylglucosaminyltransferase [Sticta canariensis]|nr:N-acetylglucosaminyltransferase [Sticta canariensis]